MFESPHLYRAFRVAAVWLLGACVFVGPAGVGASAFAPSSDSCDVACPCDDGTVARKIAKKAADPCCPHEDAASDEAHAGHDAGYDAEHDHTEEQGCPDDCPSCAPGLSFAVVMSAPAIPAAAPGMTSLGMLAPSTVPPTGTALGVFRPPRTFA